MHPSHYKRIPFSMANPKPEDGLPTPPEGRNSEEASQNSAKWRDRFPGWETFEGKLNDPRFQTNDDPRTDPRYDTHLNPSAVVPRKPGLVIYALGVALGILDRKSTRLNSSHRCIS